MWGIYNPHKILPVGRLKGQKWPSGRPANGQKNNRWACRSTARSTAPRTREQRLSGHRLPGRPSWIQRADSLSGRPPGRTEAFPGSRALWRSTDPVDRPPQLGCVHVLCTSIDRPGRPLTATVDRQSPAWQIWDLKTWYFILYKIP